jgi:hypothetical protein
MGFFGAYSAYQVGDKKNVWDLRDYGFSGLWVKRASTVQGSLRRLRSQNVS